MKNLLDGIEEVLLMGPGPSCVPDKVYKALAKPTLGHMDYYFIQIMNEVKGMLQKLMETKNELTLAISATGSAGMEAAFVNLVEPDDPVLICINGVFGTRMADIAERLRADVDTIEFEWGTPVISDDVKKRLSKKKYSIVAVVHAETSTGVKNPVKEIGNIVKEYGALYIVDAVTSLGGIPVKVDEWKIDVLYSGTQKCLSCPPGLSPITFSEEAVKKIKNRKGKVPNWYLDMNMIMQYWGGQKRVYHHTAPINMLYAIYQALVMIFEEGIDQVFKRHEMVHQKLVYGLEELGFEMLVPPEYRLPMLNAVNVPRGVDEEEVRSTLRKKYKIEIGAGLGPLSGKIWRIGLMGHTAREENVEKLLSAFKAILNL